jgi:hypothetical protein
MNKNFTLSKHRLPILGILVLLSAGSHVTWADVQGGVGFPLTTPGSTNAASGTSTR